MNYKNNFLIMSFAKWIGASIGWSFGGPIGAIIGLAIGSIVDSSGNQTKTPKIFKKTQQVLRK